ncbi:hypothetical protein D3C73_794760 [compost metagenome]
MYKLLILALMSTLFMAIYGLQTDQEIAMHTLFVGKHGLNTAVHAASQQSDQAKLALGVHSIDAAKAQAAALQYLQTNLRLDTNNEPLPGTFFRSRVEVLVLEVLNEQHSFPYTYINAAYNYAVTLKRPGVVMIIRLEFPRTYSVLQPVVWTIKATSEIVY